MAFGFQTAARVDGLFAVARVAPLASYSPPQPSFDESQVLDGHDLGDGEAIVNFGELDVF